MRRNIARFECIDADCLRANACFAAPRRPWHAICYPFAMQFVGDIRKLLQRRELEGDVMQRVWGAILDGALDDMEVGAILGGLAAASETRDELMGLYRATQERMGAWTPSLASRAVAIPAYGLTPGESLLASLAAVLLRRFEVPVVMHGILDSPCGISAARILRELDVLPCATFAQADEHLARGGIAFVPAQLLSPRFAWMISLRGRLGIENAAHLVAQAIDPTRGAATRLSFSVAATRSARVDDIVEETSGDFVTLSWPQGRSPLNLATRPRIDSVRDGAREPLFDADLQEMRTSVALPRDDAAAMARWIERVASGAMPLPVPALNIVAACLYATGHAAQLSEAKAITAVEMNARIVPDAASTA
jgi:anthranilate phosphoribosyltransferase